MSTKPTVSVIMSIYNEEKHLQQSIESVLAQSFDDLEIVVVDDGSDDKSTEIIKKYKEEHARVRTILRDQPSGDVGVPRTIGVEHARGRWITFQDGDDWSEPDRIEKQVQYMKKHPGADLVGTNSLNHRPDFDEPRQSRFFERTDPETIKRKLYQAPPMPQATMFMRREQFLDWGGYREQDHSEDDIDFWIRALVNGFTPHKIKEPLYHYRVEPGKHDDLYGRGGVSKIELLLPEHYSGNRSLGIWGHGDAAEILYRSMEQAQQLELTDFGYDFVVKSEYSRNGQNKEEWRKRDLPLKSPEDIQDSPFFVGGSYVSFNGMQEELMESGYKEYDDFVFFV